MNESRNPWKVVSRANVYENNWIRVDHHEVVNPSGGPGIYGVVHFKNYAIGVVPIDEHGNVILVGQYRFPLNAYSWEIPEGGGNLALPILESAQRELREECGLTAQHWLEIIGSDLSNSATDESAVAFLAWDLADVPADPEETEHLEIARVPFWQAVERLKCGELRDSLTVMSLLRVALMVCQHELPAVLASRLTPR